MPKSFDRGREHSTELSASEKKRGLSKEFYNRQDAEAANKQENPTKDSQSNGSRKEASPTFPEPFAREASPTFPEPFVREASPTFSEPFFSDSDIEKKAAEAEENFEREKKQAQEETLFKDQRRA